MTQSTPAGLALTILAGVMSGNCMLPAKFVRSWKWENLWSIFILVSLVILPWSLAFLLVHHLAEVYGALSFSQFVAPVGFGAGWGIAQILFGISVMRLGLGIAYAIIVGLGAVLGTLVPLFVEQHNAISSNSLSILLFGILLMVLGITLTAWGGHLREQSTGTGDSRPQAKEQIRGYPSAILLAVLCGLMAPMLNYSFAFGQNIARQAVAAGNSPFLAAYSVWPIGLAGGFLPNAMYSVYLLSRHRSWSAFRTPYPDMFWSSLMAALWMGAVALYGMSAVFLGALGTSVGWGLFQIFMIMAATMSGLLTGEWRNAPGRAKAFLGTGLTLLIIATLLFTLSNRH
jgi:multidrug transporter EmrE-like cation transporter